MNAGNSLCSVCRSNEAEFVCAEVKGRTWIRLLDVETRLLSYLRSRNLSLPSLFLHILHLFLLYTLSFGTSVTSSQSILWAYYQLKGSPQAYNIATLQLQYSSVQAWPLFSFRVGIARDDSFRNLQRI